MKNLKLLVGVSALICAACAKTSVVSEPSAHSLGSHSNPAKLTSEATAALYGKWTAEVEMPKHDPSDPGEKMAYEMAKAFASSVWLELKEDGTFTLSMIFPIEGTWKKDGKKLSLNPTKFMGMSEAELKKQAKEAGAEINFNSEDMVFDISADSRTLTLNSGDPKEGSLIFRKQS